MPWIILLVSAVLEAVWATALGESDGLSRPLPTVVFAVAVVLSMLGLGHAAKHIAISTAYAVWTGAGAALTVTYAMVTGTEAVTALRVLFLAGIVAAVIGLKLIKPKETAPRGEPNETAPSGAPNETVPSGEPTEAMSQGGQGLSARREV